MILSKTKIIFAILTFVFLLFLLTGCKSQAEKDIEKVKTYVPPGATMCIAAAYNKIAPNGIWSSYKSHVVKFNGNCMYNGIPLTLEVYFITSDDKAPFLSSVSINGMPANLTDLQNIFITTQQQYNSQIPFKGKDSRGINWGYCDHHGCNCHEFIAKSNTSNYCATCGHKAVEHS